MDINYRLIDLPQVAAELIHKANSKIMLFYGEMGVGKTTLIKELCKLLGTEDVISSPTFSLVNEYHTTDQRIIYHFDFYRIKNEEEAYDIGVEDYFYSNAFCLIEWPENIQNLVPLNATTIHLTRLSDDYRHIRLIPHS